MKKIKIRDVVLCALFAALSAVLSQVSIPIGPVPINFVHFGVFTAAGLLGAKRGALSQIIFVLIGLAGAPVFSNFLGGIGVLAGPTGGFILSYILCAFIAGIIIDRFGISVKTLTIAFFTGWVITYLFGIPWFMYVTGMNLQSTAAFMLQFLPGDVIKTILSIIVIRRLKNII